MFKYILAALLVLSTPALAQRPSLFNEPWGGSGGGSGTVNSGLINQFGRYGAGGTTLSGSTGVGASSAGDIIWPTPALSGAYFYEYRPTNYLTQNGAVGCTVTEFTNTGSGRRDDNYTCGWNLLGEVNLNGVTNAGTAAGNAILHFAATPANIGVNDLLVDVTNPTAITTGTSIASFNGTSVTMNANAAGGGVQSGDTIQFVRGNSQLTFESYYNPGGGVNQVETYFAVGNGLAGQGHRPFNMVYDYKLDSPTVQISADSFAFFDKTLGTNYFIFGLTPSSHSILETLPAAGEPFIAAIGFGNEGPGAIETGMSATIGPMATLNSGGSATIAAFNGNTLYGAVVNNNGSYCWSAGALTSNSALGTCFSQLGAASVGLGGNTAGSTTGSLTLANVTASGTVQAANYNAGATPGVSCSGSPSASYASINGITTHC